MSKYPTPTAKKVLEVSFDEKPEIDFDAIAKIALKLVLLVVASGIMAYLQGFLLSGVSQKISYRFRRDLNEKDWQVAA